MARVPIAMTAGRHASTSARRFAAKSAPRWERMGSPVIPAELDAETYLYGRWGYVLNRCQGPNGEDWFSSRWQMLDDMRARYGFGIPFASTVTAIARRSPHGVVEIGAGLGYLAQRLSAAGVDVLAYDVAPPVGANHHNNYFGPSSGLWAPVLVGGSEMLESVDPRRTLVLSWPPLGSDMALHCLRGFRGRIIAYIGEGRGGADANDAFFDALDDGWAAVETQSVIRLPDLHDHLTIYERRRPAEHARP